MIPLTHAWLIKALSAQYKRHEVEIYCAVVYEGSTAYREAKKRNLNRGNTLKKFRQMQHTASILWAEYDDVTLHFSPVPAEEGEVRSARITVKLSGEVVTVTDRTGSSVLRKK